METGRVTAVLILAEITALLVAFTTFVKVVWPKIKSTDAAVNHGRMPRIEKSLDRGSQRMDRIEERIDANAEQTHDRLEGVHSRIEGLEEGQREMLALLRKEP